MKSLTCLSYMFLVSLHVQTSRTQNQEQPNQEKATPGWLSDLSVDRLQLEEEEYGGKRKRGQSGKAENKGWTSYSTPSCPSRHTLAWSASNNFSPLQNNNSQWVIGLGRGLCEILAGTHPLRSLEFCNWARNATWKPHPSLETEPLTHPLILPPAGSVVLNKSLLQRHWVGSEAFIQPLISCSQLLGKGMLAARTPH